MSKKLVPEASISGKKLRVYKEPSKKSQIKFLKQTIQHTHTHKYLLAALVRTAPTGTDYQQHMANRTEENMELSTIADDDVMELINNNLKRDIFPSTIGNAEQNGGFILFDAQIATLSGHKNREHVDISMITAPTLVTKLKQNGAWK